LREPEAVGVEHDQGVRARHVEPGLDDRRAEQHVELALVEVEHHVLERLLAHLAVADRDPGLGDELLEALEGDVDRLHAVVEHVDLPAARQFPEDRVAHEPVRVLDEVGLDRVPLLGRRLQ